MRVIHCRRCGTDNPVTRDVDGKHCDNCGETTIYCEALKRQMAEKPPTPKTPWIEPARTGREVIARLTRI